MPKYPVATQKSIKAFTSWIQPDMGDFKFACCDCGMVHDMRFRVVGHGAVQFKLRRNKKETKKQQKRMRK